MLKDSQELAVSTNSPETVNAINGFFEELLSVGKDAQVILKAVEADPTCVIANAYAAAFYLFSGTGDTFAQAANFLNAAKTHLAHTNEREQLYIAAIDAWAKRDIRSAITYHEAIAEAYPRDLVSLHICQYHYRNSGDSEGMLRIAEKVLPANRDSPYMYGMLAFGLEECHCLSEAEEAGRRATEMKHDNRWAHHAVAHVLETQGRLEDGITWMESVCDTWENSNPAFYSHLWWHTALYHLDAEDITKVLEIYDTHIWGRARKDNGREQVNAISLLLRLELRGVDVGSRWQEIAAYLQPRLHEHILGFMDLHYLYALVRAGKDDWAAQMLESMQIYAHKALPYVQATWLEVVLPAARGMIAHAQGELLLAIAELELILPRLHQIGGSHAQRDLFEQVYLDALIRSKEYHKALSILEKRHAKRSNIPIIQRELAYLYKELGHSLTSNYLL
jgi:hypothetical protein